MYFLCIQVPSNITCGDHVFVSAIFFDSKFRHTFTTRMLLTVIPSENYAAKGATLQSLIAALVEDMNDLRERGLEVGVSCLSFVPG